MQHVNVSHPYCNVYYSRHAVFVCFYFDEWAWFNCNNISGTCIYALYTCVLILYSVSCIKQYRKWSH